MKYTIVIKSPNKLFEVDFKEIWHYRDLLYMFVKRDIATTRYKQTILGHIWHFVWSATIIPKDIVIFGSIAVTRKSLQSPNCIRVKLYRIKATE